MTCNTPLSELIYIHKENIKKLLGGFKMKTQNFGIEIELTGITRAAAAQVIADYFGNRCEYVGGSYQTYEAYDNRGRRWKCMYDASIRAERKTGSRRSSAGTDY